MKNEMNKMNKINEAALENVNGGTKAENFELLDALGVESDVCLITLTQMLFYSGNVCARLHALDCSPNEYHDADTYAPLTHAEVMARLR